MKPTEILKKYYNPESELYKNLIIHNKAVTQKALSIAKNLQREKNIKVDLEFLKEAVALHDVAVFLTNAPDLHCFGKEKYIRHGILGREILEKENLPKHALVCERHVGVGLTKKGIEEENLPLPTRNMLPKTIEEKIVCVADNFFSKDGEYITKEKPISLIKELYENISPEHVKRLEKLFEELCIE